MAISGAATLSNLTEQQFSTILQFKLKHEGQFFFNPTEAEQVQPQSPKPAIYNKVRISWNDDTQMKTVLELLSSLLSG